MPHDRFFQIKVPFASVMTQATHYTKLDSFLITAGTNVKVSTYYTEKLLWMRH